MVLEPRAFRPVVLTVTNNFLTIVIYGKKNFIGPVRVDHFLSCSTGENFFSWLVAVKTIYVSIQDFSIDFRNGAAVLYLIFCLKKGLCQYFSVGTDPVIACRTVINCLVLKDPKFLT